MMMMIIIIIIQLNSLLPMRWDKSQKANYRQHNFFSKEKQKKCPNLSKLITNAIRKFEKILSTPSFGEKVKPSVPCCRFAACKRSLNLRGSQNSGKITTGHLSRPQLHLSLLGSLASLRTEAPGG